MTSARHVLQRTWPAALSVGAAAGLALAPLPARFVERVYSSTIYPPLQSTLTSLSNLVPVALFDVALVAGSTAWIVSIVRDVRQGNAWRAVAGRAVVRTGVAASVVYLAFALCWGLNYRRLRLPQKIEFDTTRISVAQARELANRIVARLNAQHAAAHAELAVGGSAAGTITAAFHAVQPAFGITRPARPGRPKHTLLDWYFRSAAVDGMTDPFFLETLIVSDLVPVERPFVVAHEWAHLAGFADEGEANFVGWLTCSQGSVAAQYSGSLFLYREVVRTLAPEDRSAAAAALDAGPVADLRAIAERLRRNVRPAISDAGWRVYDRYLKANQVAAGAASYTEVVRLVLGAGLDDVGLPRLRGPGQP